MKCTKKLTLFSFIFTDAAETRHNILLHILAEHKVLLDGIVGENTAATKLMELFSIKSEEKLK